VPERPASLRTIGDAVRYDVVVPTVGRPSLADLLARLATGHGPLPDEILLVDDRPAECMPARRDPDRPAGVPVPAALAGRVRVVRARGAGPAAARNTGWRATGAEWVAFLDDDVVPGADWRLRLAEDLASAPADVAGSQGRLAVPLPAGRRPTDWERNVAGLEHARWATADLAYRRDALEAVGGFDERFRRAYREDTDLGLRLVRAGWRIERGRRQVTHPVRPAGPLVSVALQAGNTDDVLALALHGRGWRRAGGVPAGRRPRHLLLTAAGVAGLTGLALGRRRLALAGIAGWAAGTAELAWARIAPGPRTRPEIARMLASSALLPAAATWHWLGGLARHRRLLLARLRPSGEARSR
jgi:glycosyl transferase family 2